MPRRKKIVIADDNRGMCETVSDFLTGSGHKVDAVYNGYELLTYLKTNTPAIIILDLMMPEKSGLSIFNTLKQVSPYSRIIIYTGYEKYRNSVYARAADRFLVKGDSLEGLLRAVEELM
ncbi:MAG: response regulator [Candidatus Omnitrophota bacterium]